MPDLYSQGVVRRPVLELMPGDHVDLEGDVIADPLGDDPSLPYEYCVVEEVDIETPECVCVYFENWNPCGFPTDYSVEVDPEQVRSPA